MRVLVLLIAFAGAAHAVPSTFTYEGRLSVPEGDAATHTWPVIVRLYDGDTLICQEEHVGEASIAFQEGRFSVEIGAADCAASLEQLAGATAPTLELMINNETLAPRIPLRSVPFALIAGEAEHVEAAAVSVENTGVENEMLQALLERILEENEARRVITVGDESYARGAVYRTYHSGNSGEGLYGSEVGGYAGAKALCEELLSETAHMCTAEEMARSAQLGLLPVGTPLWYTSALFDSINSEVSTTDCNGWVSGDGSGVDSGHEAPLWQNRPTRGDCDHRYHVACCDFPEETP